MTKYKVIKYLPKPVLRANIPKQYQKYIEDLKEQFGLYGFSDFEVYETWTRYSDEYYCAKWIIPNELYKQGPNKSDIEKVFRVKLKEVIAPNSPLNSIVKGKVAPKRSNRATKGSNSGK